MNLTTDRLLCAVVLFSLTLLVGAIPVYLFQLWTRRRRTRTVVITTSEHKQSILSANFYIQVITQIGGGVLLFTVFVHMIPEIQEDFDQYITSNSSIFRPHVTKPRDLPFPYLWLAICSGFFAIHLAEVLMHSFLEHHDSDSKLKEEIYDFDKKSEISEQSEGNGVASAKEDQPVLIAIRCHKSKCDLITHQHDLVREEPLYVRFLHGLVIISAFSIHSIFDGISIGVKDTATEMWTMFIAICSHKLVIALIVSVEVYEKCSSMVLVVFHMALFAVMAPIGIVIVVASEGVTDGHSEANPVTILLSAIASGTLIYIVFLEILQKDRVTKLKPITQYIALIVGFLLMFSVTATMKEE